MDHLRNDMSHQENDERYLKVEYNLIFHVLQKTQPKLIEYYISIRIGMSHSLKSFFMKFREFI